MYAYSMLDETGEMREGERGEEERGRGEKGEERGENPNLEDGSEDLW